MQHDICFKLQYSIERMYINFSSNEQRSILVFHFVPKVEKSRQFSKSIMVEIKEINESAAISEHANDYTIDSSEEDDDIDDPTLNGWNYQNSFNWIQNQNPIYLIGVVALLIMVCLIPCKISLSISFPAPIWILMVFIGIQFSQDDDMTFFEQVHNMVDRFYHKMTSMFGLHN